MIIKTPEIGEKDAVRRLWEVCFPEGGPAYVDWFFSEVYRREWTLGLYGDEGALLSCLQMIPYTLRLRGRDVVTETLSGVSTDPSARNRGYARRLMAEGLADMARREIGFTFLYPFDHCFYQKLGWETCSLSLEYVKPALELPRMPEGYRVRRLEPDVNRFDGLYRAFMAGRNGYVVRGDQDWRKRFGENRSMGGFVLGCDRDDALVAYALCEPGESELLLSEFVYQTLEAAAAVLAALRPQQTTLTWKAPADDGMYFTANRWMDRIRLQPHVMLRIVDAAAAVRQTAVAGEGQTVLELTDRFAPWNEGRFCLTASDGSARLERTDDAPQFRCGSGTLCRVLSGFLAASEAVDTGEACGGRDATALLDGLYPKQNNFIFELY